MPRLHFCLARETCAAANYTSLVPLLGSSKGGKNETFDLLGDGAHAACRDSRGCRGHRPLHPSARKLRRLAVHRELHGPAAALLRALAAARQHHARRHQQLLPSRGLRADRGHAARKSPAGPACRSCTTPTASRTSTGQTRRTSPSEPVGHGARPRVADPARARPGARRRRRRAQHRRLLAGHQRPVVRTVPRRPRPW